MTSWGPSDDETTQNGTGNVGGVPVIYPTEAPTEPSSTGVIVGLVVAGFVAVAFVVFLIVCVIYLCRRGCVWLSFSFSFMYAVGWAGMSSCPMNSIWSPMIVWRLGLKNNKNCYVLYCAIVVPNVAQTHANTSTNTCTKFAKRRYTKSSTSAKMLTASNRMLV